MYTFNSKREYFMAQIREKDAIIESLLREVGHLPLVDDVHVLISL